MTVRSSPTPNVHRGERRYHVKKVYREFQESLTNDLVTGTGSEADTWTLLSDKITGCTEQKNFRCLYDPLQLRQVV